MAAPMFSADWAEASLSGQAAPDCVFMEMFGEVFWVLIGFAAIRVLIKLK
eukprot:CAMPEP_0170278840 /NCGR_PEP_ID=MMETSP0116_2-20130129/39428_1 /TAXON_ID=400756 /ORGANISM="Durinskia baltica, Strain CSIRO CS-38" /LENGTH=49 /DNA_ID= /DNA_START= /DNA_END= /DNA_ORIENTATION=